MKEMASGGIVRCECCRAYINPFVTWTDGGRCCGHTLLQLCTCHESFFVMIQGDRSVIRFVMVRSVEPPHARFSGVSHVIYL